MDITAAGSAGAVPDAAASAPAPAPAPLPATPAAATPGAPDGAPAKHEPLSATIARFFGAPDAPQQVSYRVAHFPNEIITVFSDPNTGKEIAQFPAEVMVQIAEFFDKQTGIALDRDA